MSENSPKRAKDRNEFGSRGSSHLTRRQLVARGGALAALAVVSPSVLAACGSSESGETSGDTLESVRMSVPFMPDLFDVKRADADAVVVLLPALEPLARTDPMTGKIGNHLTSFEIVSPSEYVLTPQKNVTFWDGTPMTIKDVLYSINLHREKGTDSVLNYLWVGASSVKQTGNNEITVKLKEPNINFPAALAATGVVSEAWYTKAGTPGTSKELTMGTGPYQLMEFNPGKLIRLERYDGYWGDPPPVRNLSLEIFSDEAAVQAAVQTGDLDAVIGVTGQTITQFEAQGDLNVERDLGAPVQLIYMNPSMAPFDDINVRKAIAHAIDNQAIVDTVWGGQTEPLATIAPNQYLSPVLSEEEIEALTIPFDLEAAKAALADSKVPDGFDYDGTTPDYVPTLVKVGQVVSENLSEIGINFEVKQVTAAQYDNNIWFVTPKTTPMSLVNVGQTAYNSYDQPLVMLSPAGLPPDGFTNLAEAESPELTRLSRALNEADPRDNDAVRAALIPLLEWNKENYVYIPLAAGDVGFVSQSNITYRNFASAWQGGFWYEQLGAA